jgi:predicted PurR-regulated permease PerM
MSAQREDLARTVLSILCILLFTVGSLWVLAPFLAATVWATTIVVATWPMMKFVEARFGGRRKLAVAVMTLLLLLLLVIPLWGAIYTIADNRELIVSFVRGIMENGLPQPPAWVAKIPLVGEPLAATLSEWAAAGPSELQALLGPYLSGAAKWIFGKAGSLGGVLLQFLLTVVISAVMYASGESAVRGVCRFGRRLAGDRGEEIVLLAGKAIKSVALGVGVTAVVQTVLGAIGLMISGVPFAALLSAVLMMLCIAQLGPSLVLFPAVAWLYWKGWNGTGTFLLVWSVVVASLDNVLRPVLIRRGADLPLLLIFAGVIGGLLTLGLIGIFVGPVVLAVTYKLLESWLEDGLGESPAA